MISTEEQIASVRDWNAVRLRGLETDHNNIGSDARIYNSLPISVRLLYERCKQCRREQFCFMYKTSRIKQSQSDGQLRVEGPTASSGSAACARLLSVFRLACAARRS